MTTTDARRVARRRLPALTLLLALGVLAACGDEAGGEGGGGDPTDERSGTVSRTVTEGGEPADPASELARPPVDFRAEVTPSADAVTVTYTFTNRGTGEVLVPDRLPDGGSEPRGRGLAYVTGDGGGITISQRVFSQPDTDRKDWAQPPRVGATRVPPGGTVRAELRVPRPFERVQPFGDDLGYGQIALPDPAASVRFCLGVLPSPYPVPVADQDGVAAPVLDHGRQNAAAQHLLCSEPVPLTDAPGR